MSNIRSLRHIKTHGSLDRQGLLIGVAKNMHGRGGIGSPNVDSLDWKVESFKSFGKKTSRRARSNPVSLYRGLEDKVLSFSFDEALELLKELRQARDEGLQVCSFELKRLEERVEQLKKSGQ